ncbi:RNA polymerase sigma factor [Streptomyces sp. NPDC096176]|uniref:RNA polymerase sigma factor n=1 Tax=Streptomyces sp. NPDC096176 TaxID=3366079 RepID=UPI003807DF54
MTRHSEQPPDREEERGREQAPSPPPGVPPEAVAAFVTLVRDHDVRRRAIGFCLRAGLPLAQAEDLVQNALLVLWLKWPALWDWEAKRQWGFFKGIVRRMIPGYYEGEKRRRTLPQKALRSDPDIEIVGGEIAVTAATEIPHQAAADRATLDELQHLLTHPRLAPNYRASLQHVDDGLTVQERAELHGTTEGAERVRTHRARARAQAIKTSEEEGEK